MDREAARANARYRRQAPQFKRYRDSRILDQRPILHILETSGVPPPVWARLTPWPGVRPKPFHIRNYKGRWRWPLDSGIITSEFGARWGRWHYGIDIAASFLAPVRAAASGIVLYAGRFKGYGNLVILRHDQVTTTLYAHNYQVLVRRGQQIQGGHILAHLGSTGYSTGPHLHFEFRKRRRAENPRKYLPGLRF